MGHMIARVSLWCLAALAAAVGLPAALAPRAFYDGFPLGRGWVAALPPYNQHLVTDVGGFYLAFVVLFAWAALTLQRPLIVPLCTAWSVAALLHFGYHVAHLDGWDAGDAIAQTVLLALVLALPVSAVAAAPRRPGPSAPGPR
jgi:hypothetical protein